MNNKQLQGMLFNDIYNRSFVAQPSGADDVILLEVAKESLCNKASETGSKLGQIWCAQHGNDDSSEGSKRSYLNLDIVAIHREVVLDQYTLLVVIGQGKGKKQTMSSSQSHEIDKTY